MEKSYMRKSAYLVASIAILIAAAVFIDRKYIDQPPAPLGISTVPAEAVSSEIMDIIDDARTWGAIGPEFYGKPAPEMKLTDIDGKMHKLSEYKGKEVLVVFWATWCPPCNIEVPHLIKLRNTNSVDKLQILAISSEQAGIETVREFVDKKDINYTAIWTRHSKLPVPFVYATDLPTAFFIDKQGNFKLITFSMTTSSPRMTERGVESWHS